MLSPRDLKIDSSSDMDLSSASFSAAAVRFSSASFGYASVRVLHRLSFTLARGSVACLLGPSGCGKTTVLRLIAGLDRIDEGQIFLEGREVCSKDGFVPPESRAAVGDVGMVFQDFALFPHLTVRENLSLAFPSGNGKLVNKDSRGGSANGSSAKIGEMLEMVELVDCADKYPHCLSGGQQQRVALARALVSSPRLLLLDEPFANLDVRLRDRIRDRTLHLVQSLGCSVLLVTHDAEEGMYMADSLFVMGKNGNLVQSGSPRSVYGEPRDAFVASLLSEVNRFEVAIDGGYVSTPFGRHRANFSGNRAEVVIRPRSLQLSSVASGEGNVADTAMGVVETARMIGGQSLVHLSSCLPASASGVRVGGAKNVGDVGVAGVESCKQAIDSANITDCEHDCEPVHLHARVAGCFLPDRGTRLRISVDRSDMFIFAKKRGKNG